MKMYGGVEVKTGSEWSALLPGRFTPGERALLVPLYRKLGGPPEPVWTQRTEYFVCV
jgi:hypothetical protein